MDKNLIIVLVAVVLVGGAVATFRLTQTPERGSPAVSVVGVTPTVIPIESTEPSQTTTTGTNLVTGISLSVSAPANNATLTSSPIAVRGKTVANAEVFVNDAETKADANGNFSVTLSLDEGDNYILVVANDISGNYSEKDLTVTYSP